MLHVKWVFQYISFLSLFQFVGRKSFVWQNCHSFMRQFLILVGCLAGKVHQLSFSLHSLLSLSIPKKMCTSDLPSTHRFYKDWLLGDCRSWTLSCFILCITPLPSFLNFFFVYFRDTLSRRSSELKSAARKKSSLESVFHLGFLHLWFILFLLLLISFNFQRNMRRFVIVRVYFITK